MSALKKAKGDFDSPMCLSASAVTQLQWWVHNLPTAFSLIQLPAIDHAICSDGLHHWLGWGYE
jgi:hypothetical protein